MRPIRLKLVDILNQVHVSSLLARLAVQVAAVPGAVYLLAAVHQLASTVVDIHLLLQRVAAHRPEQVVTHRVVRREGVRQVHRLFVERQHHRRRVCAVAVGTEAHQADRRRVHLKRYRVVYPHVALLALVGQYPFARTRPFRHILQLHLQVVVVKVVYVRVYLRYGGVYRQVKLVDVFAAPLVQRVHRVLLPCRRVGHRVRLPVAVVFFRPRVFRALVAHHRYRPHRVKVQV